WAVGFTPLVHSGWKNNDSPYDEKGPDMQFAFPTTKADTAFDWTQYFADFTVPSPDAGKPDYKALSVRLHIYGRFQGVVYFDDLNVQKALPTGVKRISEVVNKFTLEQNYPNPFNPTTTIRYSIPEHAFVTLRIYDMLGREVKTLINAEQNKGVYNVIWNGENNYGSKVSSGTYIYRIEAGNYNQIKKMILLK
ncbi:MAG: T9SS type A sorting domain-containing protein, partial [Bacteroidota bacterium]|nr:T9SS type A sorting domain-containing protein [Bacteroidota bacterium]MDP4195429.1 T9SS type A sorting domain-containing protein [Bacteroidota bacterium]